MSKTVTTDVAQSDAYPDYIDAINPATGEHLGTVPFTPLHEIPTIFENARKAQVGWYDMSFEKRRTYIFRIRDYLIENADSIATAISQSNGKTRSDALNTEVLPSIMACDWYAKKAKKFLKRNRISSSSILFANKRSYVLRMPLGVVGVISPWNYPFSIPFGEIIMGLMAGNAVLYKTSEETPLVGVEIEKAIKAGCLPKGLCTFIMGYGPQISDAFFQNKIDKIFFTGSVRVGQILMKRAAEEVMPLSLELGGNDAMIVLEDANLERAANGAVWGGFQNSGQTCAGIERVYVQESVAEDFIERVVEKTMALRQGVDQGNFDIDVGSMTTARQLQVVKNHIEDALKKGAKIAAQVKLQPSASPKSFYPATVLVNVNHEMDVMKDETFGPVIGIMTFKTHEEAITLANDSDLGLSSSIWSQNTSVARKMAERLQTGMTTINDHIFTHGASELPWTGWKKSGLGVTHAHLGLEEMTKVKLVNYDITPGLNTNLWWFPVNKLSYEAILETPKLIFGTKIYERADILIKRIPKLLRDPLLKDKALYMLGRVRKKGKKVMQNQFSKEKEEESSLD
ncbi:aldehyde dehydrogenase family protein [Deltaproteobacteria bacterium TL4]